MRWAPQLAWWAVDVFFIDTQTGRVATRKQLAEAGQVDATTEKPLAPWHPIRGDSDATTLWFAVLRKREQGVFIGTLCFRHTERQASLEAAGWEEVPVPEIGVEASSRA